jgi:hypothetical protein
LEHFGGQGRPRASPGSDRGRVQADLGVSQNEFQPHESGGRSGWVLESGDLAAGLLQTKTGSNSNRIVEREECIRKAWPALATASKSEAAQCQQTGDDQGPLG